MKHLLFVLLFLSFIRLEAQQIVDNPPYQFRNTGIYRIEKIELSDQSTQIHLLSEFIPNWWVQFSKDKLMLKDNLGNQYSPLKVEGINWDQQKPTPASGRDHFIFTFPPLAKEATSLDWLDEDSGIYGISLNGEKASDPTVIPSTLLGNWLSTEGNNRWCYGFYPDFAIIDHRFWDYEKAEKKGKKLILHLKSDERRQQLQLTLQKDGNYKIGHLTQKPQLYQRENFSMEQASTPEPEKTFFQAGSKAYIQGYIHGYDPRCGFTSGIIYNDNIVTDEDFITAIELHKDGRFSAEVALDHPISNDIIFSQMSLPFYIEPGDTLMLFIDWEDWLQANRYRNRDFKDFRTLRYMGPSSKINADLAKASIDISREGNMHFREQAKQLTPTAFKAKALQKQDEKLGVLKRLNEQYHFSPKSMRILETHIKTYTGADILDFASTRAYFKAEDPQNKILQTEVTVDYYDFLQQMPLNNKEILIPNDHWPFFNRFEYIGPFMNIFKNSHQYSTSSFPALVHKLLRMQDSIYTHYLHLEPSRSYDIIKIRSLSTNLNGISRTTADSIVAITLAGIKDPYFREKADYLLEKYCPTEVLPTLPMQEGKGATIFRKIIAPYAGKVIFVDFWATSCGPCRAGIKEMEGTRKKYREKDIVFLFITDEVSSPLEEYNRFTADLEGEKLRLPQDEYNYLQELFQFNGIPHYELINKQGEVVNSNYYQKSREEIFDILLK